MRQKAKSIKKIVKSEIVTNCDLLGGLGVSQYKSIDFYVPCVWVGAIINIARELKTKSWRHTMTKCVLYMSQLSRCPVKQERGGIRRFSVVISIRYITKIPYYDKCENFNKL